MNILVTGSAGGLGRVLVSRLRAEGHSVAGVDVSEVPAASDPKEWPKIIDVSEFSFRQGPLQSVVIAGAVTKIGPTDLHLTDDFMEVVRQNLVVPFAICKQVCRFEGPIRVVAVGSASAHQAMSRSPSYVASKAGLEAMIRAFAREFARRHLFFTVAPGAIDYTPMTGQAYADMFNRGFSPEEATAHLSRNPLKRLTSAEEVCKVIEFCLFEAPEACSGATFKMPMASGVE